MLATNPQTCGNVKTDPQTRRPDDHGCKPGAAPKLCVIFVNHRSSALLDRAVFSLREAEPALRPDVLVVDNASPDRDALVDVCRRHGVRLIRLSRNLGYGAAANRGLRYTNARYVAVANPDITFEAGSVSRLVQLLDENPNVGAVGPQLFYPDGQPQPSARRYPSLRFLLAGRRSPLTRLCPKSKPVREFQYLGTEHATAPVKVEALIGTFIVVRTAAIAQTGLFSEDYFLFAEDIELCRRLNQAGWKVLLEPRARIRHYYGGTRREVLRFSEYHRIKALTMFMATGHHNLTRLFVQLLGLWYYLFSEGLAACGIREYERSWQGKKPLHTATSSDRGC